MWRTILHQVAAQKGANAWQTIVQTHLGSFFDDLPVATEGAIDFRELRLVPSGAERTRPPPRQTRKASARAERETLPLTEASGSG